MDKKTSINPHTFFMAALTLFSAHTFAETAPTASPEAIPETTIQYASGDVLTWKEGQYVTISHDFSSGKKIAYKVKMSKHLGAIEGVAKGPTVLNTQMTWAAFSVTGAFICGLEKGRSLVACGRIEGMDKASVIKAIETHENETDIVQAVAKMEKSLGIKELNEAIKGLKAGDKYKGFQTGSAFTEIDAWRQSRGWPKLGETSKLYDGFDPKTVGELAKSGDIRAIQLMASTVRNYDDKIKFYELAAIYGSTAALVSLANTMQYQGPLSSKKGDEKKPFIKDIMAYYEVARLRGDSFGDVIGAQSLLVGNLDVQLTPEEVNAIKVAGTALYDKLEHQRFQKGLGKFDNTVPESVKTYYEMRKNDIEG